MVERPLAAVTRIDAGELFRRHAQFVVRFLARLGCAANDLDDMMQEVFMTAHRKGGYVEGAARPSTWLAEIAMRVASTKRRGLRRNAAKTEKLSAQPPEVPARTPADALETSQALARVQKALDELDLDRRAVFVLFELEGESCETIAAGLGKPVGTIYSRLHAARRQFKEAHGRLVAADQGTQRGGP